MGSRLSPRRAFSLVELLVVIGIIALLAAIIFPVYASSRRKAYETRCISNLHQLAIAWNQYNDDHGGVAPNLFALHPYIRSGDLYYCPADYTEWGHAGEALRTCAELDGDDPDEVVPYPLTYMYGADTVWANPGRLAKLLRDLEVRPKAGIIGCPCHGERVKEGQLLGSSYTGLALRARPDASVVRGHYQNTAAWATRGDLILWGNEGRPE